MIEYIVEVSVQHQSVDEWVNWMSNDHIPDVMSTGIFLINTFLQKALTKNVFVITYTCESLKDFRKYQMNYAKEKQLKHTKRFGEVTSAQRKLRIVTSIDI
ncbi:MAG: DUF4286 family protein [Candidatus Kapabacteria bacterium]|nr:DUF4286 family protein [Candidatus Kapabacteria bacterium]